MVETMGQQYNVGEEPIVILYTYIIVAFLYIFLSIFVP